MALDLSALEDKTVATQPTGKPLDIPLADIEEDPDQPRKEFSAEAMQEITVSVRIRGIKTPISVRTHPSKPGKWMLNYGARRYRGSIAAGRDTIPAFVDEAHDDYDQVVENIQRDDLKPMELALFIKKRLDAGDQKTVIAKNLGKDGAIITQHLALIDSPACVEDAYSNGKCTSPKTLYELRGLYEKFPERVEAWCTSAVEITRKSVAELADELKGKKQVAPATGVGQQSGEQNPGKNTGGEFGHAPIHVGIGDGEPGGAGSSEGGKAKTKTLASKGGEGESGQDLGELTSWPKGRAVSNPDRMRAPLMLVEFDGRSAAVLLNRRPSNPGLIYIRFEDGGGDQEVDAGACKINLLTESEK